jgi:hypothetical protein
MRATGEEDREPDPAWPAVAPGNANIPPMIALTINGQPRSFPAPLKVSALIVALEIVVAVGGG